MGEGPTTTTFGAEGLLERTAQLEALEDHLGAVLAHGRGRLVLATYRDDELDRAHPLRIVLGELPRRSAQRLALAPLSAEAVAALAGSVGVDHGELHRRTAGNPFFVTEVLAAADAGIPETV